MSIIILANALKEFDLALDDLASSFEFVRVASRLRPRLGTMLNWQHMDLDAKNLAKSFLEQRTAQESLLYRGLVISLAGAFEQLLHRVVRESVLYLNRSGMSHEAIPDNLRKQNTYRTGIALQTIFGPPDHLELDYDLLSKNIGTCIAGSKPAVLNADAFAIFLSIFSPDRLAEALDRLGVKLDWDVLGGNAAIRTALEKNDTRETANALKDFLKRFGQVRNKIAHTGASGIMITETDFEQIMRTFRSFGRGLTAATENQVAKLAKA